MDSNLRTVAALFKHSLDDMFNQWETAKPLRTGAPHASAILQPESEWCLRRQVLLALFPEEAEHPESKPWDAHGNAVFLNGWHIHEKYQRLFQQFGRVIEIETAHYDDERMVWFTPDAILEFGGQPYVVEIKGYRAEMKSDKPESPSTIWERLDETGTPPKAAWHQCNLYCHILGIQRGLILVENKNTQELKCWCIEHSAELARSYTDRMYAVKGKTITKTIPARACKSRTEHRAEKCPMRELCFSGKVSG